MDRISRLALIMASMLTSQALAQSDTAFTYQGSLIDSGTPATGTFDMGFSLWNAMSGGVQSGSTITILNQSVTNGLFNAELDFNAAVIGAVPLWLEITVNGNTLSPRQPISNTPFSIQTRGIFVDANKKVGLGTLSPQYPLHVEAPAGTLFTIYGRNTNSSGVGVYGKSTSTDGRGVFGHSIGTTGITYGVYGQSNSSQGYGVYGLAASPSGINFGVRGISSSTSGRGVSGQATAASGATYGVYGQSDSPSGRGVVGFATSSTGINFGVRGLSSSTEGRGVLGHAMAITGETFGIYGQSDSVLGRGVVGDTTATTGSTYGVYGKSTSTDGRGVFGHALATTGTTYGVYGQSDSTQGRGVIGIAKSTAGSNTGVLGQSFSSSGIGVNGSAFATTGFTVGVFGNSNSTSGFDFFAGGAGSNYGASSSIRWKNNIVNIDNPLEKIAQLRGVYFDWDQDHGGQHDVGMIAEEVGKVLPEIVAYEDDGLYAHGMDYSKLTPLLVEALNALRADNNERIEALEKQNAALRQRLGALEESFADETLSKESRVD